MNDKNVSKKMEQSYDIHQLKRELKELRELKDIIDKTSIIIILDEQGRITYVNDLFCVTAQYSREELIGKTLQVVNSGHHSKEFFKQHWHEISRGNIWKGDIKNKKKDGTYYWVRSTIIPFLNKKGKPYKYIAIQTDITKEKELEEELKQCNKKYELISEYIEHLVALVDEQGKFYYISPTFNKLLHDDLKHLEHQNLFDLVHTDDLDRIKKEMQRLLKNGKFTTKQEFRLLHSEGNYIDVEAKFKIIHDEDNARRPFILLVMSDISVRKKVEQNIYHLVYYDSITNLPNCSYFMKELRSYVRDIQLTKEKFAIFCIDLDHFKWINDEQGHDVGDMVIANAANNIKEALREQDVAARMSSDEFMVLVKSIKNQEEAIAIVKAIIENFRKPLYLNGKEYVITCSVGVVFYPEHGKTPEELIKNADYALSEVKQKSKNNYMIFDKQFENVSLERRIIENTMRKGLKEHQFFLEYQPKFNIQNNQLVGVEALVRWNHPDLGEIPPAKFISLAEETGLIVSLGEWIIRESCKQGKEWQDKGFGSFIVAVNVSMRQLQSPDFVQKVEQILNETGFDPKLLEFELTESVLADLSSIIPVLKRLRDLGIHISVDDFGTGYSSLSYIKHLPVDTLKVDASFIKDIHNSEESKAIFKAIVNIADTIGLKVIAEGIEMEAHVDALLNGGCTIGQGFFYSRPLKKEEFEEFIQSSGFMSSK